MDYPKKAECVDWLFIETKCDIKIRRNNTTIHINFFYVDRTLMLEQKSVSVFNLCIFLVLFVLRKDPMLTFIKAVNKRVIPLFCLFLL